MLTLEEMAVGDVDQAFYPDSLILIISLMDEKIPEICTFQIEDRKIEKRTIKITQKALPV